jgi:superfamily I DNA and/or RNA helicase
LHPTLSKLSNKLFYNNELLDGVTPIERAPLAPDIPTLLFCDTEDNGQERQDVTGSIFNLYEAQVVVHLVAMLLERGVNGNDIGVIALYKAQGQKIHELLQCYLLVPEFSGYEDRLHSSINDLETCQRDQLEPTKESSMKQIQVSTVDAFQGGEKEVIIVTCCRTSKRGFIDSPHRVNVALTRAKRFD